MKKTVFFAVLTLAIGAGAVYANCGKCPGDQKPEAAKSAEAKPGKNHDCGDCPMHKKAGAKKCSGKMCPEKIAGVVTTAKNVPNGVEVTMTAKDKDTVTKLQELALVHYGNKATMDPACPGRVEGAEIKLENTADGAKVLMTGKTTETIKKIQEAAAKEHAKAAACPEHKEGKKEAKASKKYTCAMKCVVSEKPGKCPKCGMPMGEIN
ncbi:MAG: hypothetical protein HY952_05925 [Elusimicrobia bacterium]|nr:hypothetical protein [Elusimicrobiota bacterium]